MYDMSVSSHGAVGPGCHHLRWKMSAGPGRRLWGELPPASSTGWWQSSGNSWGRASGYEQSKSETRCPTLICHYAHYVMVDLIFSFLFGWQFVTSLWHWCSVAFLVRRTWRRWPSLFRWSSQWVQSKPKYSPDCQQLSAWLSTMFLMHTCRIICIYRTQYIYIIIYIYYYI